MFATGLASLRLTVSLAAFSALAGSRLELASGGATEGAMEPSTLPTVVSHIETQTTIDLGLPAPWKGLAETLGLTNSSSLWSSMST